MLRLWGSDFPVETPQPFAHLIKPQHPVILPDSTSTITSCNVQPPKRRHQSFEDDEDTSLAARVPSKKVKTESESFGNSLPSCDKAHSDSAMELARDTIRHEFGLDILRKHNELRLINQELAKCQVALEQLRRCHLIPYPINCPTPEQMINISAGKGLALQTRPGEPVPRWAPPFGIVEGPYARHYAKWLIPDPSFDGVQPEWQFTPEAARARSSYAEGRITRNSFAEPSNSLKRPMRGNAGQKLQSLSSGYPQPKEKAGPCILKRSDGQTVKLVCLDCNRENFSSTQGFINHCRIAHKRDFKSHDEAAIHSGHPIAAPEATSASAPAVSVIEDKAPQASSNSPLVHPFSRPEMTEQQVYSALRSRISESLKLYNQSRQPGHSRDSSLAMSKKAFSSQPKQTKGYQGSLKTPYLSQFVRMRSFDGNLDDVVADATAKVPIDDVISEEESEGSDTMQLASGSSKGAAAARTPVVMRVPAKSSKTPASTDSTRPASSKSRAPPLAFVPTSTAGIGLRATHGTHNGLTDEDIDMEDVDLSPNTIVSNNAPSLVSDDGEYDDSDDGSSVSGVSDHLDNESVSDVAEITLDDEQEPRNLRRGSSGASGAVRLRKHDAKHVTFMSPVKNSAKHRRTRRV